MFRRIKNLWKWSALTPNKNIQAQSMMDEFLDTLAKPFQPAQIIKKKDDIINKFVNNG